MICTHDPRRPRLRAAARLALAASLLAGAAHGETLIFQPNELVSASTASGANAAPVVEITDDGVAHALWVMGAVGNEGIYVASCPPGGAYGSAARVSAGTPASVDSGPFRGPTLRTNGSVLVAGWKNRMSDAPEPIWAARSRNAGVSWEPAVRADPGAVDADDMRDFQAVAVFPDGRLAHMWMTTTMTTRTTRWDWSSDDGAGNFGAAVDASAAMPGQPCECCYPDQVVLDDGTTVLVASRGNDSNIRVIHVQRSTDGGLTFPEDHVIDTTRWYIDACPATGPSLAADGDTVLATWLSGATGAGGIWLSRSTDGGATWSPIVRVNDLMATSINYPEVALRGPLAVVVWEGRRMDGGRGIFATASIDAGVTWGPVVLVSDDPGTANRLNPSVAIGPDFSVEVVWIDQRLGPARLFRAHGVTANASGPHVLREKFTGALQGSGPAIASLLFDGLDSYRALFGAPLPFSDPEPVLRPGNDATLVFYAFDDPSVPRIGVVKDVAAETVRVVELP